MTFTTETLGPWVPLEDQLEGVPMGYAKGQIRNMRQMKGPESWTSGLGGTESHMGYLASDRQLLNDKYPQGFIRNTPGELGSLVTAAYLARPADDIASMQIRNNINTRPNYNSAEVLHMMMQQRQSDIRGSEISRTGRDGASRVLPPKYREPLDSGGTIFVPKEFWRIAGGDDVELQLKAY